MTKPSHVIAVYDLPILATVRRYLCLRRGRTNWFRARHRDKKQTWSRSALLILDRKFNRSIEQEFSLEAPLSPLCR
jgi:hypothetical protein